MVAVDFLEAERAVERQRRDIAGLDQGYFNFFMQPEQSMQFVAVEDIGRFVAAELADPGRFGGKTLELASNSITGVGLQALFSHAAGRAIAYSRFSDETLAGNYFLRRLTELVDSGALAGSADLAQLREIVPGLHILGVAVQQWSHRLSEGARYWRFLGLRK